MKKRLLIALLGAGVAILALGIGPAAAIPDSLSVHSTQHYGPYPSTSPDSGTCGNDWATDSFDRVFRVHSNRDDTFTVVQQFKHGTFVTNAGPSPGSCDLDDGSPPGLVSAGITGQMHGEFIISNVMTQTSSSPFCDAVAETNANCTTATFINTHFAPCYPATCSVTTYHFNYSAGGQGLVEHHWKNASEDRGGNRGDIRSTDLP